MTKGKRRLNWQTVARVVTYVVGTAGQVVKLISAIRKVW
jgi:hypothetical protein